MLLQEKIKKPYTNPIMISPTTNTSKTRNVCETCMPPPNLNVTVTLTFDLDTPNLIGIIY